MICKNLLLILFCFSVIKCDSLGQLQIKCAGSTDVKKEQQFNVQKRLNWSFDVVLTLYERRITALSLLFSLSLIFFITRQVKM